MDTSNPATNESVSSRKTLPASKRQQRSAELKRQIVEETLVLTAARICLTRWKDDGRKPVNVGFKG